MPALPIIWGFVKGLPWKWIGLGLAAAALLTLLYKAPWAYKRGVHSRDAEVAQATNDRDTWKANAARLQDGIDEQNLAVERAKEDGNARVSQGKAALAAVQKANEGQGAIISRLRAEASKTHSATEPCEVSPLVAGVKL